MLQKENASASAAEKSLLFFRYNYILLPFVLALACIILAAVLYVRLPDELGIKFQSDGTPVNLLNKGTFIAILLGLQVGIATTALVVALIILKIAGIISRNSVIPINIAAFVFLMSNMLLLPQIILGYLMVDSFVYALRSTHFISFSAFSLWALGIGTIIIFVMFTRVFMQLRANSNKK